MLKPAIPGIPRPGNPRDRFDGAVKEVLELLTGDRGTFGGAALVSVNPGGGKPMSDVQTIIAELVALKAAVEGSVVQPFSASTINGSRPYHLNPIRNGAFQIAQRGTSFAAPATNAYDMDGWINTNLSAAVFTVAQVAGSVPGRKARQVTITTADASVVADDQVRDDTFVEGYDIVKYVGQTFTVAFRMSVPVIGIHCVSITNTVDKSYVVEINFPTANTMQDCSFTITGGLPTTGTWNYTNGIGFRLRIMHMAGTSQHTTPNTWGANLAATANQVNDCATIGNVWAIEEVRMGLGTVAPEMETDYHAELARSQAYYEKSYDIGTVPGTLTLLGAEYDVQTVVASVNGRTGSPRFKVKKRIAPTITIYNPSVANNQVRNTTANTDWSATTVVHTGESGFGVYATSAVGSTINQAVMFHWTASAEL